MDINEKHIKLESVKVVTHDGRFHADDVLCVALLQFEWFSINLVRTRDPKEFETADFVLDVGGADLVAPYKIMLDHHGKVAGDSYPNGCLKSACGKLAEVLYEKRNPRWLEYLRNNLLYGVESQDNGQDPAQFGGNKLDWIGYMNPAWNNNIPKAADNQFNYCVSVVVNLLNSMYQQFNSTIIAKNFAEDAIAEAGDKEYVVFDYAIPWKGYIIEHNKTADKKIKLVVYFVKTADGKLQYNCQVVPLCEEKFDSYISLPESWAGLNGAELEQASGIAGGIFCHAGRFISGWSSKEAAIEAAKRALAEAGEA